MKRIDKAYDNGKDLTKEEIILNFCPSDYDIGPGINGIGCLRTEITCKECWHKRFTLEDE